MNDSKVAIYSAPTEEPAATDFALTVEGRPVFTHRARVSAHPFNQVWPGYQRPLEQTEIASFAAWDMRGPVDVVVVSASPVQEVRVRPRSAGITPVLEGNTIRFCIEKPGQYTVEINGTQGALHLFANPPEETAPDPGEKGVRYFGPGVHSPGLIRLESHQTVYLAAGAVVHGAIFAEKAQHITVRGRGILDGSQVDRMEADGLACFVHCTDVRLEGIILRDSNAFTVVPVACRGVQIRNIKIIGNWRYNADGIDFINCQDGRVEDSFVRTFDDCIALKGYEKFGAFIYRLQLMDGKGDGTFTVDGKTRRSFRELQDEMGQYACNAAPIRNIEVRRCVIWNDWGRALEIGAETVSDRISDIFFEDCDIIHATDVALDVQNCDRGRCANIVFRNIRVELDDDVGPMAMQTAPGQTYAPKPDPRDRPRLIVLEIGKGYASYDAGRGHIENIRFENIEVTAPQIPPSRLSGYDETHAVDGVTVNNLRINGQLATTLKESGLTLNEFVRGVTLQGRTLL